MDDDTTLGTTIRAWRDRLSPTSAGLPVRSNRRSRGLRREELAELAGISVDYVVRLEQGRSDSPSAQVAASIARALQLSLAERDHLYRLAGLAPPPASEVSDHITPGLRRLLNRLGDSASAVFAADWQLIWWNHGWASLLGDPSTRPLHQRNFARDTFLTGDTGPHLSHWPVVSNHQQAVEEAVVSDLRRATGRFPASDRLHALIAELSEHSPRFCELWAAGTVGAHREQTKVVHHPTVGSVTVDCDVIVDGDADRKIVILTAAPDTEDETNLRLALIHPFTAAGTR